MSKKEYYKKWYQRNKERLNERRRKRYQNDPSYRAKQKAMSKRWYQKERGEPVVYVPKDCRVVKTKKRDGTEVDLRLYTVGKLAGTLGVTIQTIRNWENRGLIPITPIRLSKWRLYSQPMINVVASAYKKRGHFSGKEINGRSLFDDVSQGWDKILCEYDIDSINGGSYE